MKLSDVKYNFPDQIPYNISLYHVKGDVFAPAFQFTQTPADFNIMLEDSYIKLTLLHDDGTEFYTINGVLQGDSVIFTAPHLDKLLEEKPYTIKFSTVTSEYTQTWAFGVLTVLNPVALARQARACIIK